MQKIVLEEILKAEQEAEKLVKEAQDKAAEIVSAADSDYNRTIIEAKEEAQKTIQDAVLAAKEKAKLDFEKAIKITEDENNAFLEKSYDKVESIADNIALMLLKPEYEKE